MIVKTPMAECFTAGFSFIVEQDVVNNFKKNAMPEANGLTT